MQIDKKTIFEIHRLNNLGWSQRKIATNLRIGRRTVGKYLENPDKTLKKRLKKPSKLDPYRDLIDQLLDQDPEVKAPVVLQRLCDKGFEGKISIVRSCLRELRGKIKHRQPFIRFESPPGKQFQIDWGHFGSISYNECKRKLYALVVIESYSRVFYVEFTHSQKQETLHQCLLNAFSFFGGTTQEIVVDNMSTAVTHRQGNLVQFNGAFLDFLRIFKITPRACNIGAPHEKGKVENVIKYIRQNFWPLRSFEDLCDVQLQALSWLNKVANVRIHQGLGQRPIDRFKEVSLTPLPVLLPDCRETCQVRVHKDFAIRFDGNSYTTPPWVIGREVTVKADSSLVTIYLKDKNIAIHARCWERKIRNEVPSHTHQVKKLRKKMWQDKQVAAFASLGQVAVEYLKALVKTKQPIRKSITKLLALKDEYGAASILYAIQRASSFKAYGVNYIENILYQEMVPTKKHPPVRLKKEELNSIRLPEPSLSEYDLHIIKRSKKNDD